MSTYIQGDAPATDLLSELRALEKELYQDATEDSDTPLRYYLARVRALRERVEKERGR